MKRSQIILSAVVALLVSAASANAQRQAPPTTTQAEKPIIFAVINDGQMLEPIAFVEGGKLTPPVAGDDESSLIEAFNKTYYTPKSSYRLIFGGANAGTVTVKSSDTAADCSPNMAQITVAATRANLNLKGKVMALATNVPFKKPGSGVRRLPTWPERNEIDVVIRAEFAKNSVEIGKLDYHNLTALDVDGNKKAELIGSFWVENDPKSRTLMFFIAEKDKNGKYAMVHSDLRTVKEDEVMSGDITALDEGVYHELLLDVFDYDGDGVSEIFTYVRAFEGSGLNVYKREGGKWSKVFEGYNYHCGY